MPKTASLQPTRYQSRKDSRQWCVSVLAALSSTGKRQQLFFHTKLDAELEAERLKTRKINFGHSLSSLSAERIAEASACFRRLDTQAPGVTLTAALNEFLLIHSARTASVPVATLWEKYIASRSTVSPVYRQKLYQAAQRLSSLRDIAASDLTAKMIEEAISSFPPSSKNAVLAYLRAALNFGIRAGWLKENPVDLLEFASIVRAETEVFAPATVEALLRDALENDLTLVPFLVLAFYAGVRPDGELQKVLWTDIDLGAKKHHLTIRAAVAKKRRKRWIDLSNNALAWLGEYQARGGRMDGRITPFSASTLRRKRRANAQAAGLTEWPQQGARHTYCSCWLAQHGDINGLVIQAGHESATIMWDHYYRFC